MKPNDAITRGAGMLVVMLALVAGYLDAYAVLNLKVFCSFMSGNTTLVGLHTGQGFLLQAWHNLLPILCFVTGVVAGSLLYAGQTPRTVKGRCRLVAALLAGAGMQFAGKWIPLPPTIVLCVLALFYESGRSQQTMMRSQHETDSMKQDLPEAVPGHD